MFSLRKSGQHPLQLPPLKAGEVQAAKNGNFVFTKHFEDNMYFVQCV